MNAITPAFAERPAEGSSPIGEISAAWRIAPDALMLLGWQREKPAARGIVALQKSQAQRGQFNCVAWQSKKDGVEAHRFLTAIRLARGSDARCGEMLSLTGCGEAAGLPARLPERFLDPVAFATELARAADGNAASVARFLTDAFTSGTTRDNTGIRTMITTFLERGSEPDGCIEIVGAIQDGGVFLQGWGVAGGSGREVILAGAAVARYAAHAATFARPDMRSPSAGQILLLPAAAVHATPNVAAAFLLDRGRIYCRKTIAERQLLSESDTIGHIGDLLPSLRCDPETRAALRTAFRPRFEGRLTLTDGGHPVRMAVDLAVSAAEAGTYLTGWLYDPAEMVQEVRLHGTFGDSARLDDRWTRIPRQDVTEAFRTDPTLPRAEPGQDGHGFAVHTAKPDASRPGEAYFLEVFFRDGKSGFVPLTVASAKHEHVRTHLLASVDLHKQSGMRIIERHLGPLFERLSRLPRDMEAVATRPACGKWQTAIVTPLAVPVLPRALLSQFLRDPLTSDEGLVFVCGPNWDDAGVTALRALSSFYGVPAAIVRIGVKATPVSALDAAAQIASAGYFLLLGAGTIGRTPGWRQAMRAALKASGRACCVSPTVLYEDDSIRFAGMDAIEPLEVAPYVQARRRRAGMPAFLSGPNTPETSFAGSLACCLMPREIINAVEGASRAVATASGQEAELFIRMQQTGIKSIWVPAVQVYATEEAEMGQSEAQKVGLLIDGWLLRARLTTARKD